MTACVFAMKIIYEGSYYRCYKKQEKNWYMRKKINCHTAAYLHKAGCKVQ
jgi:hypothetical protein